MQGSEGRIQQRAGGDKRIDLRPSAREARKEAVNNLESLQDL